MEIYDTNALFTSMCVLYNKTMLRVFPTETVSRSYVLSFAKQSSSHVVFEDEFVSWDTFKSMCCNTPNLKKASYTDRRLFAQAYLKTEKIKFEQAFDSFASLLAKNIVYYKKALERQDLPKEKIQEYSRAFNAYQNYLSENALYEQDFLEPDFSKAPKDTLIYFASSINDCDVLKALQYFKSVENTEELPVLNVYQNAIGEIRDTFRKIRKLLESNTPAGDIAITCVEPQSYLTYLKEESSKRNIKLSFMFGKHLSKYPAGMFFKALNDVVQDNYSYKSMKNLLLNPCYPFKDRTLIQSLMHKAVDFKISDGGPNASNYKYKLKKTEDIQELEFINTLSELASYTVKAQQPEQIQIGLRRFQDCFFKDSSWDSTGNSKDIKAFQRCMEVLTELANTPIHCNNPYSIFLDVLDNTTYVVPDTDNGVRVYSYPLSCGLSVKHHFIMGLSDDYTRVKRTYTPFIKEDSDREEIGDNIIKNYCYQAQNMYLSCSLSSYSSEVCIPAIFIRNGNNREVKPDIKDSFWQEERNFATGTVGQIKPVFKQVENFSHALETTVNLDRKHEFVRKDNSIKLSASSLMLWKKCPFTWLIQNGMGINEQNYEINMDDAREIGQILHDSYEIFLKKIKEFDNGINNEKLLKEVFFAKVDAYAASEKGTDRAWAYYIKNKYKDVLIGLFSKKESGVFAGSTLKDTEHYFKLDFQSYSVSGFIDCILQTPDGSYLLIDLKKKNLPSDSLQLVLYAKAVENPVAGAFYSVENMKYKVVWKDQAALEELSKDLDIFIEDAVSKIKNGQFDFARDSNSCVNCPYRRICRRRYVIK